MWDFSQFLGGNQTHFCFKMLLNVSDLVSGAHLLPPKSFLIKDRDALVFLEPFSLTLFPFLLPHTPFHNKELLLMHTPFLSDGIPVSNSTVFQNSCPTPSDLYSAPRSKLPLFQVPSRNDEVGRTEIRCCIHMILKHHTRRWKDMGFSVVSLSSLQLSCSPAFISYDIIGNRIPQMPV